MNQDISKQFYKWLSSYEKAPDNQCWEEFRVELKSQWEKLELQNIQLKEKIQLDKLTGLLNYPAFCDQLKRHIKIQSQVAVIMLDIDDFKQINRIHGHLHGNKILEMLSRILKQELPMSGFLGRFGGDEFLIAFPCHSELMLRTYCTLILEKIRQSRFSIEHEGTYVSVSIGATLSSIGETSRSLIQRSDQALSQAKIAGKDRYHYQESNSDYYQANLYSEQ